MLKAKAGNSGGLKIKRHGMAYAHRMAASSIMA